MLIWRDQVCANPIWHEKIRGLYWILGDKIWFFSLKNKETISIFLYLKNSTQNNLKSNFCVKIFRSCFTNFCLHRAKPKPCNETLEESISYSKVDCLDYDPYHFGNWSFELVGQNILGSSQFIQTRPHLSLGNFKVSFSIFAVHSVVLAQLHRIKRASQLIWIVACLQWDPIRFTANPGNITCFTSGQIIVSDSKMSLSIISMLLI